MSLKNIELQVALPRTVENSRNQQILQQQGTLQNEIDSEQMRSRTEKAEQTVAETQENERAEIRERQKQGRTVKIQLERGRLNEEYEPQTQPAPHPYKGHKLDIQM